ncbi:MAG TPA: phosphatidylglycerol lysyltransferase domain-containing protein [Terriglobia bacterium]|nr:phosphatidylglycerol lysyltransferase domain-containing protein [Terriglobia bacterium]
MNLYSVIGPALPDRSKILRGIFPLEFLHLSRSLTLIIGFALVISSINIYKRKRRAFVVVTTLAFASVVLHLTKGLDYEEATFSFFLLAAVVLNRKHFTVRSGSPDVVETLWKLAVGAALVLTYGILGFWLLDPREFGTGFSISQAIAKTISLLTFSPVPDLAPRTHYATWFLYSFKLMTVIAVAYAGASVFRPVVYIFRTRPYERDTARRLVTEYGHSAQDFFKLWRDKSFFFSPAKDCFVAYRVASGTAVVLGDPVGPAAMIPQNLQAFLSLCRENDWGVAFYQCAADYLFTYRSLGLHKLKVGDDAIVDLRGFSLEGGDMKRLRNKVRAFEKSGFEIVVHNPAVPNDVLVQARRVSDEWLTIPGRHERTFTLGGFDTNYLRTTTLFSLTDQQGNMVAFANIIPSFRPSETTIDLMRHGIHAPNGAMDYLFIKLFTYSRERGFERFNLGMAPMAGFRDKEEASAEERAVHYFFQRLNFLFSYQGLLHYKTKFASSWEPRYLVFPNVLDLPRIALALAKVTEPRKEQEEQ